MKYIVANESCAHEDGCNNTEYLIIDASDGKKYCPEHSAKCDGCNEACGKSNLHIVEGKAYCEDCYNESYMICPHCGDEIVKDNYIAPNGLESHRMSSGGCTNCCVECDNCQKVVDQDTIYNSLCEDCYSERYGSCEECGKESERRQLIWSELLGGEYCDNCYLSLVIICYNCNKEEAIDDGLEIGGNNYCEKCFNNASLDCYNFNCSNTIKIKEANEINGNTYCDECANIKRNEVVKNEGYDKYIDLKNFDYSKYDKYLVILEKLVPISVKELKLKYPRLFDGLRNLIVFSGGKDITQEIIANFKRELSKEKFNISYSLWGGAQRSVDADKDQLVINVLASDDMLNRINSNEALKYLFNKVNNISNKSGHPYIRNQVGWARIEVNDIEKYIMVDEIQSDHQNAAHELSKNINNDEVKNIKSELYNKFKLNDEQIENLFIEYKSLLKDFPNIAMSMINSFAKNNGFVKIYWHTYEGGKELKKNSPPKSLYDKFPRENFFEESSDKPFGLEQKFYMRQASYKKMYKLARKILLKNSLT